MDATVNSWECESVVVLQEPANRKQGAGDIFAVVDAIGWSVDSCDASNVRQSNAHSVFLAGTKIEWSDGHWIGYDFKYASG